MILYVETSFIVGAAFGREEFVDELLQIPAQVVRIALPEICIMEAWSAFEDERRRRNRFTDELRLQAGQMRRDRTSVHAAALLGHLERAIDENDELLPDITQRLRETLEKLGGLRAGYSGVELVRLTKTALTGSLTRQVMAEPTDGLILAVIADHARRHKIQRKAFLSANSRDFGAAEVRAVLASAGIDHYFANTEAFLGWFRAGAP
jgi:hypothetical protein